MNKLYIYIYIQKVEYLGNQAFADRFFSLFYYQEKIYGGSLYKSTH